MERATDSSLPGTGLALKMTVSLAWHASGLALTAGRQDDHFVRWQLVELAQIDDAAIRNVQESEIARNAQVLLHAAADDACLASQLVRRADHFAQSPQVRCERRDQHPTGRLADQFLERFTHSPLGRSPARLFDAHAVAQQNHHPFVAKLTQSLIVRCLALNRRRVELEVAGVEHDAGCSANDQADGVGNAVIHRDRLDLEWADACVVALSNRVLDHAAEHAVLFELD